MIFFIISFFFHEMWGNIIVICPFFLNLSFVTFLYFWNNLQINSFNSTSQYSSNSIYQGLKDFNQNLYYGWVFSNLVMIGQFIFVPFYLGVNSYICISVWQIWLVIFSYTLFFVFLHLLNYSNIQVLNVVYNEFFIIFLMYLPFLSALLIFSTNIFFLYLVLEIFAVILLLLVYTTTIIFEYKFFNAKLRVFSKKLFYLIFYQFVFNFYSSIIFAFILVYLFKSYGLMMYHLLSIYLILDHTYYLHFSSYPGVSSIFPSLFVIFFLIKFGVGPWFQFKIDIYSYISTPLLLLYVYVYLIFLLPYGLYISIFLFKFAHSSVWWVLVIIIFSIFWVVLNLANYTTVSSIIGVSSVIFYIFILSQLFYLC